MKINVAFIKGERKLNDLTGIDSHVVNNFSILNFLMKIKDNVVFAADFGVGRISFEFPKPIKGVGVGSCNEKE